MTLDKVSNIVLFLIVIIIGFLIGFVFSNKESFFPENTKISNKISPYNHIPEQNILFSKDQVIIKVNDPRWATFENTNSMNPVFDIGANTIQIIPKTADNIHIGDIVSYRSRYSDEIIIHRVVDVDYDDKGWYARMKGDNNLLKDPGRIRFNQVRSLTIAIVY